ncbi:MAG TPA: hypothetical protein VII01_06205 [Solirubrobacteraceae bacterium]
MRPTGAARGILTTALVGLAAATAGCGKADYHASDTGATSTTAAAVAGSGPAHGHPHASGPVSVAREAAFERAVNLVAVDIPGATVSPRPRHPESEDAEARRCGGAVSTAGATQEESPNFTRGKALTREAISSRVTVLASAQLARESVAVVARPSWLACYEGVLRRHFTGGGSSGVRVNSIKVTRVPVSLPGITKVFGIRILAEVSSLRSRRLTVKLYLDAFGFALGRAEINMDATSYVQPEATRTEQDLLRLMNQRAGLHPL